ncbi:GNAT family N-acetyltransferase [Paludifilum halophilum]|uniref:N-acetyltransferase domain-containing protein n=1 Tax=Paludifilum halophilum TaxID=1642702 RepID=A0A235B4R4_9BACL|nr:GNAT family protein [Paludifilum halophilum]OYD07284.1 hypothetical protein CHM34_12975 [Paludifilum halophilum]
MIRLKPLTPRDFPVLIRWTETPECLMQWAGPGFSYPLTEAQLAEHLKGAEGENPLRRCYKAIDSDTGAMVGHIELDRIDRRQRSAVIARVLVDPERRGEGIGTAMLRAAVRTGFAEWGMHRLELRVFDFNHSAITCYEKIGFRVEGTLRHARRVKDEYWNLCIMGLLEHEWREAGDGLSERSAVGAGGSYGGCRPPGSMAVR